MLLIIKLCQPEEGTIKSILSNREGDHVQIAYGSWIENSNTWIKTFMRYFMPLTRQGQVFLS